MEKMNAQQVPYNDLSTQLQKEVLQDEFCSNNYSKKQIESDLLFAVKDGKLKGVIDPYLLSDIFSIKEKKSTPKKVNPKLSVRKGVFYLTELLQEELVHRIEHDLEVISGGERQAERGVEKTPGGLEHLLKKVRNGSLTLDKEEAKYVAEGMRVTLDTVFDYDDQDDNLGERRQIKSLIRAASKIANQ